MRNLSFAEYPWLDGSQPVQGVRLKTRVVTGNGWADFAREVLAAWQLRRIVNRSVRELATLDDRLLKDIGISRGEIRTVVEAQVYGTRAP